VAHDFNNLLMTIMNYSELLKIALPEDDPLLEHVDTIEGAAERAASLTRQLLAVSGRKIMKPQEINLNSVVSDLEKMLRRLIGEDIAVVVCLDPALGLTKADIGQIEQIIMNLAVNARDAMPRGGNLSIETSNYTLNDFDAQNILGALLGNYVMLAVSDTGIGMSAETLAKIFEPFFTTKEQGKGTGLGLSAVYGILKQSGGYILVDSEPEIGTTFKIYLPLYEEVERPQETEEPIALLKGAETILVIEDEETLRSVIGRVVGIYGYSVLEASNVNEAISICKYYMGQSI
jgi:two-component system, cell cycle sensor histidine kinase and response regulator CckA